MTTSRLEIDLSAVEHNVGVIRKVLSASDTAQGDPLPPGAPRKPSRTMPSVCAVLKQDAYGLGAPRLAKRLVGCGVEMLAVYTVDEARALVEAAVPTPILVLMPVRSIDRTDPVYRHAVSGKLHMTLHDTDQLAALTEVAGRLGTTIPLHVQLDTGLSRGGALTPEATRLVEAITRNPRLRLGGLMTHFSSPCTDPAFTRDQARQFREWVEQIKPMITAASGAAGAVTGGGAHPGIYLHAANSCAVFRSSKYHGNLVRVGQSLYGYVGDDLSDRKPDDPEAFAVEFAKESRDLRAAVRWVTTIAHIKEIPEGRPVGYGSTWRAPRPTRLALLPVGYADGYPRSLSNAGMVGMTGKFWDRLGGAGGAAESPNVGYAPVVGRVSMDQCTIDITDIPPEACKIGMEVELIGRDRRAPNYLPRVAEAAGSITHELVCRIGPRVERAYRFPAAGNTDHATPTDLSVKVVQKGATGHGGAASAGGAAVA